MHDIEKVYVSKEKRKFHLFYCKIKFPQVEHLQDVSIWIVALLLKISWLFLFCVVNSFFK